MEEDKKAQRSSKGKFTTNAILLLIISFCIFYLLTLPSFHIGTVTITGNNILTEDELFNIAQVFAQGISFYHVFFAVMLLGVSGGFYIVPLYAMMQAKAPESHRARVVAANNIFNAIFMVVAAIFCIIILSSLNLSLVQLFGITAVISAIITCLLLTSLRRKLRIGES